MALFSQGENTTAVVAVILSTGNGSYCRVNTQATMTLFDATGQRLDVDGNPATAVVVGIAGPTEGAAEFSNVFDWANWCGSRTPPPQVTVQVPTFGLKGTLTPFLPACLNPGSASGLTTIPPGQ